MNCKSLKNIILPLSLEIISDNAFYECKSIKSIILPDGINEIGESAFKFCRAIKSIILPQNIEIIKNDTFFGCSALQSIAIPSSVVIIGAYAFDRCMSLKYFHFNGTTTEWKSIKKGFDDKNKYNPRQKYYHWKEDVPAEVVYCMDGKYKL